MTVSLRSLVPTDSALLAALHRQGFDEAWDEKAFAALLGTQGVFGVLAGTAQPLGFVLCRAAADEAEVLTLFVPESFRRHGVATGLLDRALADAAAKGARALLLEVAADNAAAIAFYTARGFAEVGRRPRYYKSAIDALTLKLEIGPR